MPISVCKFFAGWEASSVDRRYGGMAGLPFLDPPVRVIAVVSTSSRLEIRLKLYLLTAVSGFCVLFRERK